MQIHDGRPEPVKGRELPRLLGEIGSTRTQDHLTNGRHKLSRRTVSRPRKIPQFPSHHARRQDDPKDREGARDTKEKLCAARRTKSTSPPVARAASARRPSKPPILTRTRQREHNS